MRVMKVGDVGYFRHVSEFDALLDNFYFKVLGNSVNPDLEGCVYVKTNIKTEDPDDEIDASFYGIYNKKGTCLYNPHHNVVILRKNSITKIVFRKAFNL